MKRKDIQALSLVGPTRVNPVPDPPSCTTPRQPTIDIPQQNISGSNPAPGTDKIFIVFGQILLDQETQFVGLLQTHREDGQSSNWPLVLLTTPTELSIIPGTQLCNIYIGNYL